MYTSSKKRAQLSQRFFPFVLDSLCALARMCCYVLVAKLGKQQTNGESMRTVATTTAWQTRLGTFDVIFMR